MEPFSNKSDLEVVDLEELLKVKEEFSQSFPVEFWASRIHWEKVDKKSNYQSMILIKLN